MKSLAKRVMKGWVLPMLAGRPAQPVFQTLHRFSLWGMNVGAGSEVANSGELALLRRAAARLDAKPHPVIFDVGANVGDWTTAVARVFGSGARIHCFEPSARTRAELTRKVAALPGVSIHPFGAGSSEASVPLFRPEESGCASVYQRRSHQELAGRPMLQEEIHLVRLDEFCRREGIDEIDFLKLDIEGHELAALQGCGELITRRAIRFIQFEFGGCNIDSRTYFHDFWDLLQPHYGIFRVLPRNLWEITNYRETLEVFTTTNLVAIAKSPA